MSDALVTSATKPLFDNGSSYGSKQSAPVGTAVFADDFEAYSIGQKINNIDAQTQLDNGINAGWKGESYVDVHSGGYGGSSRALRFQYGTGDTKNGEMRFQFADSAASQYASTEVWAAYKLFVPTNYAMDAEAPLRNNKCLFIYNDDTGGSNYFDFERWTRGGTDNEYLDIQIKKNGASIGWGDDRWGEELENTNFAFIDLTQDKGAWIDFKFYVKLSDSNDNNGIARCWKNGVKILGHNAIPNYNTTNNHLSGGYLLGWTNSSESNDFDMLIDDFELYTTDPGWGLS